MKNPWKGISKVNPQRENGHREIANDVFGELIRADLTGAEMKVCLCIISHTWGYGKTSDTLSHHIIAKETALSLRHVKECVKLLRERRFLYCEPSKRVIHGSPLNEYLFNKHWDTWLERRVSHSAQVSQNVTDRGATAPPLKKVLKKRIYPPSPGKPLLEFFKTEYQVARGKPYHVDRYPKQQGVFTGLLKDYNVDQLKLAIRAFLRDERQWLVENGHTVWLLSEEINRYIKSHAGKEGIPVPVYVPSF